MVESKQNSAGPGMYFVLCTFGFVDVFSLYKQKYKPDGSKGRKHTQ